MIGAPPFPRSIDELDAATLTEALGVEVASFNYDRIGADRGMLGDVFLVTPEYGNDAAGPNAVICKFASLRDQALASALRGGTHERELRCYDELLQQTRVSTPAMFGAWYDPATAHYLLVQQAIHADTAIDQVAGVDPALAALVVDEAAQLHHQWWQHEVLSELEWLPRLDDPRRIENLTTLAAVGWEPLCDLVGSELTPAERRLGKQFPKQLKQALRSLANMPSTLIHSDLRADNLLFAPDHQSVTLVDWQGAGTGPGSFDLAYLLVHSLTVEDRRSHGDALIDRYSATLAAAGTVHERDEFMAGFDISLHFGLTIACALPLIGDRHEPRVKALAAVMARRSLAALDDHDLLW